MTAPSFVRACSLGLARDRFLFADAFIKRGRLVLVSTYYPDLPLDFARAEVMVDGELLERFTEVGKNEYEPTRAVSYALDRVTPRAVHELVVRYDGHALSARLAPEPPLEEKLSFATMFKNDHANVAASVDYYRRQGVERFFLWYNGDISRVAARLPVAPDIVYGEWDFRYWFHEREPMFNAALVDPTARRNHHHAQVMFLTMMRTRFLADCSWLVLSDLDELLHVPGETLRAHVERIAAPTLSARCHWAEVRDAGTIDGLRGTLPGRALRASWPRFLRRVSWRLAETVAPGRAYAPGDFDAVWANPRDEGDERMKTIYRGDYAGLIGIHLPKRSEDRSASPALKLYHLVDSEHGRQRLIARDARRVVLR